MSVGLFFKVGAVPFHSWVPDVYQGAPTAVTAFMAAATKVAAFGAMLRLFYVALGDYNWNWRPMFWIVAVADDGVGSVLAITQTDIKRMLAYSSVAQAGFILIGVTAAIRGRSCRARCSIWWPMDSRRSAPLPGDLGAGPGAEATHLSRWAGLGKRSPFVAAVFALSAVFRRDPVDERVHRQVRRVRGSR